MKGNTFIPRSLLGIVVFVLQSNMVQVTRRTTIFYGRGDDLIKRLEFVYVSCTDIVSANPNRCCYSANQSRFKVSDVALWSALF